MIRFLTYLFALFSGAGLIDVLYLSLERARNSTPVCIVFSQCDRVLTSPYAYVLGIPLAYVGLAFYGLLFLIGLGMITGKRRTALPLSWITATLVGIGVATSAVLFYIQAAVLGAFCLYCVLSEIVTLSLAVIIGALLYIERDNHHIAHNSGS